MPSDRWTEKAREVARKSCDRCPPCAAMVVGIASALEDAAREGARAERTECVKIVERMHEYIVGAAIRSRGDGEKAWTAEKLLSDRLAARAIRAREEARRDVEYYRSTELTDQGKGALNACEKLLAILEGRDTKNEER